MRLELGCAGHMLSAPNSTVSPRAVFGGLLVRCVCVKAKPSVFAGRQLCCEYKKKAAPLGAAELGSFVNVFTMLAGLFSFAPRAINLCYAVAIRAHPSRN